jgi:hypothetical protein
MPLLTTFNIKDWIAEANPLGPPASSTNNTKLGAAALKDLETRFKNFVQAESEALQAFAVAEAAKAEAAAQQYVDGPITIEQINGNTTLDITHAGKRISAIAAAVVTFPPVGTGAGEVPWTPGMQVEVGRMTSGAVSVAPGTGVLFNGANTPIAIATQHDSIRALMDSNNTWVVE